MLPVANGFAVLPLPRTGDQVAQMIRSIGAAPMVDIARRRPCRIDQRA